jgi:plasminogen activator inhibitor 1 RNA-binding protein
LKRTDPQPTHHIRNKPNHNDRNTKFGRGGRAPVRDGKRAYDRRSGTGRGKEIKKDGGGARNWGSHQDEAKAARSSQGGADGEWPAVISNDEEGESPAVIANDEDGNEAGDAEPVEQEPEEPAVVTMTLEEYMEQKKATQSELLAPVKPREVVNEFGSLAPKKAVEEDFFLGAAGSKPKKVSKPKQNNDLKNNISKDIKISVKRADAGGEYDGGRGGRGRDGGRGRGSRDGAGSGGRDGAGRGGRDGAGRGGRESGGRDGGRGGRDGGGRGGRGGREFAGRDGGRSGRGRGGGRSVGVNVNDANAFPSL